MATQETLQEGQKQALKEQFKKAFMGAISDPLNKRVIVNTTKDCEDLGEDGKEYLMVDRSDGDLQTIFEDGWQINSCSDEPLTDLRAATEKEVIQRIGELIDKGYITRSYLEYY